MNLPYRHLCGESESVRCHPPQGTIVSPQSPDRDASTFSMVGGRGPNRVWDGSHVDAVADSHGLLLSGNKCVVGSRKHGWGLRDLVAGPAAARGLRRPEVDGGGRRTSTSFPSASAAESSLPDCPASSRSPRLQHPRLSGRYALDTPDVLRKQRMAATIPFGEPAPHGGIRCFCPQAQPDQSGRVMLLHRLTRHDQSNRMKIRIEPCPGWPDDPE